MQTTLDSIRDIRLYQSKSGYRFSVDALLLYSFVNLKKAERIVDLGAGSGIVGLLLAKKYPEAHVTLLELQSGLFKLAEKNILLNDLVERVEALKCDIRKMPEGLGGFDLAVSNPPFRKPLSGRLNVDREKAVARHELKISLKGLVNSASMLLKHRGRFCLVHHPSRLSGLIHELRSVRLEPKRLRFVHSRPTGRSDRGAAAADDKAEAKMLLLEAVKGGRPGVKVEKPLFVYKEDGSYTEDLKMVYGEL